MILSATAVLSARVNVERERTTMSGKESALAEKTSLSSEAQALKRKEKKEKRKDIFLFLERGERERKKRPKKKVKRNRSLQSLLAIREQKPVKCHVSPIQLGEKLTSLQPSE